MEYRVNLATYVSCGGTMGFVVRRCEHPRDGLGNTENISCQDCMSRNPLDPNHCKHLSCHDTETQARLAIKRHKEKYAARNGG